MRSGIRLLACLLVAGGASVSQTQGGARTSSPLPGKGLGGTRLPVRRGIARAAHIPCAAREGGMVL